MNPLTKREQQVAELLAWGASKKEIPDLLRKLYGGHEISVHTVENIARNIYAKLHLNKASELSAWYFCECYQVDDSLSPLKRARKTALSLFLLLLLVPQILSPGGDDDDMYRPQRVRTVRVERVARARKQD